MLTRSTFMSGRQRGIALTQGDGTVTKVVLSGGQNLLLEQTLPGAKKVFFSFQEDRGIMPFSLCYKFLLLKGIIPPGTARRPIMRAGTGRLDAHIAARHVGRNPFPYSFHTQRGVVASSAHFINVKGKDFLELRAHGLKLQISPELAEELVRIIPRIQTQRKWKGTFRHAEAVLRDLVRKGLLDEKGMTMVEEVFIIPPSSRKKIPSRGAKPTPKSKTKIQYQHEMFQDFSKPEWSRGAPTKKIDLSKIGQPPKPPAKEKGLFPELGELPRERKRRRGK